LERRYAELWENQVNSKYSKARSFRTALEQRLMNRSKSTGEDIMRLRRHVAFDCLLARIFHIPVNGLVMKGGYTLELRLNKSRTTKDIDFSFSGSLDGYWNGSSEGLLEFLQEKAEIDLGDYFVFTIGSATLDLENAPYGGYRFPVQVKMDNRRFATFSIDLAAGDYWCHPHDEIATEDWLQFAVSIVNLCKQLKEKGQNTKCIKTLG